MNMLTFEEAIGETDPKRRHVILGNGFSRALRDDIFAYTRLFDRAKVKLSDTAKKSFDKLDTTNFEQVMKALRDASFLVGVYGAKRDLADAMTKDMEAIREVLARTIAESHPNRPHD